MDVNNDHYISQEELELYRKLLERQLRRRLTKRLLTKLEPPKFRLHSLGGAAGILLASMIHFYSVQRPQSSSKCWHH